MQGTSDLHARLNTSERATMNPYSPHASRHTSLGWCTKTFNITPALISLVRTLPQKLSAAQTFLGAELQEGVGVFFTQGYLLHTEGVRV
jgi:hypothetical protein